MPLPIEKSLNVHYHAPDIPTSGWDEFLLCTPASIHRGSNRYVLVFRVGQSYYRLTTPLGTQLTDLMQLMKLSDINNVPPPGQASYILLIDPSLIEEIIHQSNSFKDLWSVISRLGVFEAL